MATNGNIATLEAALTTEGVELTVIDPAPDDGDENFVTVGFRVVGDDELESLEPGVEFDYPYSTCDEEIEWTSIKCPEGSPVHAAQFCVRREKVELLKPGLPMFTWTRGIPRPGIYIPRSFADQLRTVMKCYGKTPFGVSPHLRAFGFIAHGPPYSDRDIAYAVAYLFRCYANDRPSEFVHAGGVILDDVLGMTALRREWLEEASPWLFGPDRSARVVASSVADGPSLGGYIRGLAACIMAGVGEDKARALLFDILTRSYKERLALWSAMLPYQKALVGHDTREIIVPGVLSDELANGEKVTRDVCAYGDAFRDDGSRVAIKMLGWVVGHTDDHALHGRFLEVVQDLMWGMRSSAQRFDLSVLAGTGFVAVLPSSDPSFTKRMLFLREYGDDPLYEFHCQPPQDFRFAATREFLPHLAADIAEDIGISGMNLVFSGKFSSLRWMKNSIHHSEGVITVCGEAPACAARLVWSECVARAEKKRAGWREFNASIARVVSNASAGSGEHAETSGDGQPGTSDGQASTPGPASDVTWDLPERAPEPARDVVWDSPDEITLLFVGEPGKRANEYASLMAQIIQKHPEAIAYTDCHLPGGHTTVVDITGKPRLKHGKHRIWNPDGIRVRLVNSPCKSRFDAIQCFDQTYLHWGFDGNLIFGSVEAWASLIGGNWFAYPQPGSRITEEAVLLANSRNVCSPSPSKAMGFYLSTCVPLAHPFDAGDYKHYVCEDGKQVLRGCREDLRGLQNVADAFYSGCEQAEKVEFDVGILEALAHANRWVEYKVPDLRAPITPANVQFDRVDLLVGTSVRNNGLILDLVTVQSVERDEVSGGIVIRVKVPAMDLDEVIEDVLHDMRISRQIGTMCSPAKAWNGLARYVTPESGKRARYSGLPRSFLNSISIANDGSIMPVYVYPSNGPALAVYGRGKLFLEAYNPMQPDGLDLDKWRDLLEPGDVITVCGGIAPIPPTSALEPHLSARLPGESATTDTSVRHAEYDYPAAHPTPPDNTVFHVGFVACGIHVHDAPSPDWLHALAKARMDIYAKSRFD